MCIPNYTPCFIGICVYCVKTLFVVTKIMLYPIKRAGYLEIFNYSYYIETTARQHTQMCCLAHMYYI